MAAVKSDDLEAAKLEACEKLGFELGFNTAMWHRRTVKRAFAKELPIWGPGGAIVAYMRDVRIEWDEAEATCVQCCIVRTLGVAAQITLTIDFDEPDVNGWENEGGAIVGYEELNA